MMKLTLAEIACLAGAECPPEHREVRIGRVQTDSRAIRPDDLFVALVGPRFDGHNFVAEAFRAGAVAALVDRWPSGIDAKAPLLRSTDSLKALQRLAQGYRKLLNPRVIGITGSNGKTSTKEMVSALLATRYRTVATPANLNNHIGVPLTLLSMDEDVECVVVEMGMNHPGEIEVLASIAAPDHAIITKLGWAHVAAFGSKEGIAWEKGALVRCLPDHGYAILPADDGLVRGLSEWTAASCLFAGSDPNAHGRFSVLSLDESGCRFKWIGQTGQTTVNLSYPGLHMVRNASLALLVGETLGCSLEQMAQTLSSVQIPGNRMKLYRFSGGWLLDDSYNASPDSIEASIHTLGTLPGGRMVALLGAMGELGELSAVLHQTVAQAAVNSGVRLLFALGDEAKPMVEAAAAKGIQSAWFANHDDLVEAYLSEFRQGDRVLVKGSRAQTMEKVANQLLQSKEALCCISSKS